DMLDYLQRDTLYTGVPYGRVDADRLFETIEIDPTGKPRLIVNDKGVLPVESIFFSRHQMQTSVYQHHLVRITQRMMQEAVISLQRQQRISPVEYAKFSDPGFVNYLKKNLDPDVYSRFIEALFNRRLYKRVFEITWSCLETQGKTAQEILEFIRTLQEPTVRSQREEIIAGTLQKTGKTDIHKDEVLLDVPPLVTKSVSSILIRQRKKGGELIALRDPNISAIGSYIERAYQLIWKTRLFSHPRITLKEKIKIAETWNYIYPSEKCSSILPS
ncbi:MAG: hypothetical protein ACTSW4_05920, partial [Candidatus Ranarchaeia archaeon]